MSGIADTLTDVLGSLGLVGFTLWGLLALHFADIGPGWFGRALVAAFGLLGALALAALWLPGASVLPLPAFGLAVAALLVWWRGRRPSNDRDWAPEVARLPRAVIQGSRVAIENVRAFHYRTESDFTPAWSTRHYDLDALAGVDLIASYWMGPRIAHVMLSFEFADGEYLAFSIETRKRRGETYSSLAGFFKRYELIYVVADERDAVRLRTEVRRHPPEEVYLYRLRSTAEGRRRVFLEYLRRMNALAERPAFYHTLTTNCSTSLWAVSQVNPGHLPFSWKLLLSGHVPAYLHSLGLIASPLPFAECKARGRLNGPERSAPNPPDAGYSRRLREPAQATSARETQR